MQQRMFIVSLSTSLKKMKEPKYSKTENNLNKLWHIHILEYNIGMMK